MAKPNYQFEKRQRELAKKQKKAEKENRKSHPSGNDRDGGTFASTAPNDGPSDAGGDTPASPTGGR
jgi:hypothetical protein